MNKRAVIEAHNLAIGYRAGRHKPKVIHRNLNVALYAGELTCLLGANGAGKSTLMRTLIGAQPALEGNIAIDGTAMRNISRRDLSRRIGIVLTDRTAIGALTVTEVVALGRHPHTGFFGRLTQADHRVVEHSISACGIEHKAHAFMADLSDGERQKVMIAKALAQECPIVVLDEPTAFLDVVSRIEIMTLLHYIAVTQQRAILLSTHDVEQALVLADRLWLMSREGSLQAGVTEDLITQGAFEDLFPHSNIHFDPLHGTFYPTVQYNHNAVVVCHDETLLHWTVNLLNRNGYAAFTTPPAGLACPTLTIAGVGDMVWSNGHDETHLTSYDELVQLLQAHINP